MFSIKMIRPSRPDQPALGVIRIGDFVERFEVSLLIWSLSDYFDQWDAAKSALVAGSDKAAFVTSFLDQGEVALIWWPVYRLEDSFAIQNHLFIRNAGVHVSKASLNALVPERECLTDKDAPVSEWRCSIADMMAFAAARSMDGHDSHWEAAT